MERREGEEGGRGMEMRDGEEGGRLVIGVVE